MADDGMELSTVLARLRDELAKAQIQGSNAGIHFQIDDITVELNVAVSSEGGGKLGVKFWVVDASADGKIHKDLIQKISLKMKLVDRGGNPVTVHSQIHSE